MLRIWQPSGGISAPTPSASLLTDQLFLSSSLSRGCRPPPSQCNTQQSRFLPSISCLCLQRSSSPWYCVSCVSLLPQESIVTGFTSLCGAGWCWMGALGWLWGMCVNVSFQNIITHLQNHGFLSANCFMFSASAIWYPFIFKSVPAKQESNTIS